jgi:hypothetical protein
LRAELIVLLAEYTPSMRGRRGVEEVSEGDERRLNDIIDTAGNIVRRLT